MSRGRWAFGLALAALWLSGGVTPFGIALAQVQRPNDFTPDWVAAHAWLHGGPHGAAAAAVLDGPSGNDYGRSIGAPQVFLLAAYYVHPPTAFLLLFPLVPLGFPAAALAWLVISLGLLALLAAQLARVLDETGTALTPARLFPLLIFWPPVLSNLQLGQWSILLAVTLAAAYGAWERGGHARSAAWIATATALKLTPVVMAPFLVLRDRRTLGALGVALAVWAALSLGAGQWVAWRALFQHAAANVDTWQTYMDNSLSLRGLVTRLLVGGRWARAAVAAPELARGLLLAGLGALGAIALVLTSGPRDRDGDACRFALWNVFAVVANPLAWTHYAILLLLPAALTWRAAVKAAGRRSRAMAALVAGAILILTVPKETLYRLGGRPPVSPARGLFFSWHLLGALLLFAAAALGAARARRALAAPEAAA